MDAEEPHGDKSVASSSHPQIPYEDQDLDTMLQHDLNLEEDPEEPLSYVAARLKELSFPYSPQEPQLSEDKLRYLDSLAYS